MLYLIFFIKILYLFYLSIHLNAIHKNNHKQTNRITPINIQSRSLNTITSFISKISNNIQTSMKPQINNITSSSLIINENNMKIKSKFSPWSLPILKRSDRRNIKLIFLLSLITIETSSEIFVRLPQEIIYGSQPTHITSTIDAESIVLIFPGAGGPDKLTERLANSIKYNDRKHGVKRYVSVYDWSNWRGNFIRAAFDSQSVGKRICSQLARDSFNSAKPTITTTNNNNYNNINNNDDNNYNNNINNNKAVLHSPIKNLHSIGISVGAFAADSCIKSYDLEISRLQEMKSSVSTVVDNNNNMNNNIVTKRDMKPKTRLTLLDPFTSKGVFGYGWGVKNFGTGVSSADIVEDYLNTDDPVPTTSDPVLAAYTYDITHTKDKHNFQPDEGESYHSWPVAYLADHWVTSVNKQGELVIPTLTEEPKGVTYIVP